MQAYQIEKTLEQNGTIQLDSLPFLAGETVQIIVFPRKTAENPRPNYAPLQGSVLKYDDPCEPIAQDDWIATQ